MAKFKILGTFSREGLIAAVPPEYRERVRMVVETDEPHTLILFDHAREHVVVASGPVRRALAHIPADQSIVAVGVNFTLEAEQLLASRGVRSARLGYFSWTDASYESIRLRR